MSDPRVWTGRIHGRPPRLLIDINIVLDVILEREGLAEESGLVISGVEFGRLDGYIASHTVTTAFYLVNRARDRQTASLWLSSLLRFVQIVPMGTSDFQQAFLFNMDDYEDAVQVAAGLKAGADYLVTRNLDDYKTVPDEVLRCRAPADILALLFAQGEER